MGMDGYYHRFFKGFSKITNPITEIQRKNKKFVWTEKCEEAFQRIKGLLTTAPIMKVPCMVQEFLVCMDASKDRLGYVLMQEGRVITYASIKIRTHKVNYITSHLEMTVIVGKCNYVRSSIMYLSKE